MFLAIHAALTVVACSRRPASPTTALAPVAEAELVKSEPATAPDTDD